MNENHTAIGNLIKVRADNFKLNIFKSHLKRFLLFNLKPARVSAFVNCIFNPSI